MPSSASTSTSTTTTTTTAHPRNLDNCPHRLSTDGAAATSNSEVVFGPAPLPWMLSEDDHRLNRAVRKLPQPFPANGTYEADA